MSDKGERLDSDEDRIEVWMTTTKGDHGKRHFFELVDTVRKCSVSFDVGTWRRIKKAITWAIQPELPNL